MKVAILYTGAVRTMQTTWPISKKNVVDHLNADVFATIQLDETMSSTGTNYKKIQQILGEGDNLKSLDEFNIENYKQLQESLLSKMDIAENWAHYLRTSGSMIEYYQLYLSFQKMREYEERMGFQYSHIIRLRTDVVIAQPMFDSITEKITECDVIYRLYTINQMFEQNRIDERAICHLMNSLFSFPRIFGKFAEIHGTLNHATTIEEMESPTIGSLTSYIRGGNYMLTVRKNLFFMTNRENMEKIANLGITYGQWRNDELEHWWDAESQLETLCEEEGIDVFNSTGELEVKSLYEYDSRNYFNADGSLKECPDIFCFICRKPEPNPT